MRLLAFAALIATVPAFAALRYDELEDGAAQLALAKAALDAAGRIAVDGDPAYAPYAVDCPANITWVRPASQVGRFVWGISAPLLTLPGCWRRREEVP